LTVKDVNRAFTDKLRARLDDSGDHIYYYYAYEGSEYTVGKLSHSWRGSLNDTQIMMLARKLFLQKREFECWVECTMTNEEMIATWQGHRIGH
jgi:hypothetical protein